MHPLSLGDKWVERPEAMPTPSDRNSYGGLWIRFAAYVVDAGVLLIPNLLIQFLCRAVTPATSEPEWSLIGTGLSLLLWWIYTAVLLSSRWQATLGKKFCGLKVIDYDGQRISFGRATGRYFASYLSAVLLCIGFLMIGWTSRRQGLHDFMPNTLVVRTG
jgi:uncharacterized RDD family membrane protein YckC